MHARIATTIAARARGAAVRSLLEPACIAGLALALSACPRGTADKSTAPEITAQPADVTVAEGDGASFTVTATGTPALAYRWYAGSTQLGNCTTATCTIAPARAADAGDYHVEVSNAAGRVSSRNARLTVTTGPKVVNAASCNQADIQDAVNRAQDGNVVQVPAGACSFADRTMVTVAGKSLWIRGAGKISTNIRRGGFIDTANTSENDIALTRCSCSAAMRRRASASPT